MADSASRHSFLSSETPYARIDCVGGLINSGKASDEPRAAWTLCILPVAPYRWGDSRGLGNFAGSTVLPISGACIQLAPYASLALAAAAGIARANRSSKSHTRLASHQFGKSFGQSLSRLLEKLAAHSLGSSCFQWSALCGVGQQPQPRPTANSGLVPLFSYDLKQRYWRRRQSCRRRK